VDFHEHEQYPGSAIRSHSSLVWQRDDCLGRFRRKFSCGYRWEVLRAIWSLTHTNSYAYSKSISHLNAYADFNSNSDSYEYSHSQSNTDWKSNRNAYRNTDNNSNPD
jgi:hypothetical protein